jgi:hypothetical protein
VGCDIMWFRRQVQMFQRNLSSPRVEVTGLPPVHQTAWYHTPEDILILPCEHQVLFEPVKKEKW